MPRINCVIDDALLEIMPDISDASVIVHQHSELGRRATTFRILFYIQLGPDLCCWGMDQMSDVRCLSFQEVDCLTHLVSRSIALVIDKELINLTHDRH